MRLPFCGFGNRDKALIIILHTVAAFAALLVGVIVFALAKGTPRHKFFGRIFAGLMVVVATSSIFITEINDGKFSTVHLLIFLVLGSLTSAIMSIKRYTKTGNVKFMKIHRTSMIMLFLAR